MRASTLFSCSTIIRVFQVMECMLNIFTAEDQKKACKEFHQKFSVLEDGLKTFFPGAILKLKTET